MAAFQIRAAGAAATPRALTVNVSRYTPQAVLIANVEEARYDALLGEDGKLLVRARYAVRNNQRSFLAVALAAAGQRCGARRSPDVRCVPASPPMAACCCRCRRGAPAKKRRFRRRSCVYLQRGAAWTEKGEAHVELPAIDLPVSRTGLTLHYSPRYALDAHPGAFRVTNDPGPWTGETRVVDSAAAGRAPADAEKDLQALMDSYKKESGRTRQGPCPSRSRSPRRALDLSGRGAHGRIARAVDRDRLSQNRRSEMTRSSHVRIVASRDRWRSASPRSIRSWRLRRRHPCPSGGAGTVTLTRADYDRLLDLASRKPGGPEAPPVAAALTRANIRARVDGLVARATMQVDGEVFRTGMTKVPLIKGATLLDARADNRPLPVIAEGETHLAIVPGRRHSAPRSKSARRWR